MTLLNGLNNRMQKTPLLKLFWDKSFLHYAWISGFYSVINIFLLWLFIDVLKVPTVSSSIMVIGGTFVLRYLLFRLLKVV